MAKVLINDQQRGKIMQDRIYEVFDINPGKALGVAEDGFSVEHTATGEKGIAKITLIGRVSRDDVEYILGYKEER